MSNSIKLPRPPKPLSRSALRCHCPNSPRSNRKVCAASLPYKTLWRKGVEVAYVSKPDVAFLCHEIEDKHCYLQHGITLAKGDTVMDVGANIGIFAAQAARQVSSSGRVIACEPLPATFAALQHNMQSLLHSGEVISHNPYLLMQSHPAFKLV